MDCSCAPMLRFFSVESNLKPRFWSFFPTLRKDSQLCMDLDAVFAVCYRTGCALQCTKRFVVPSVGGATRFAKFAAKIFQNAKKSPAELCQIWLLLS